MGREFQRVAIVNRGEAAMRFIHAARELRQENSHRLCSIALFTDADRHAMFVREADEAVYIGSPESCDPATGLLKNAYVDYGRLEKALAAARAEAVWTGWGFVAEHAQFAALCEELGIVLIGPSAHVMRLLGDKITSKRLAEDAGIPVARWSGGAVETLDHALNVAESIGYPVFIKATAGGGGRGIRRVNSAGDMERAFETARAEAYKAFGDPTVFLEQVLQHARHVEVQIIADQFGNCWAAGVRDCTIQRRHQKILEEAPSPVLSSREDAALRAAAVQLSRSVGYHNAGTVEFLYQPETGQFAFMEMNTRLQVEHPVTECTTGLDLVKLQIQVARGEPLPADAPPPTRGHAIEVRLNAEDAENGFAAAPGLVERFRIITGPGVRVDTGVSEGDVIPANFDSMIAKIIAFGGTREEALARLHRTLRDGEVVLRGGATNKSFLQQLVGRSEVHRSEVDTNWMDRVSSSGDHVSHQYASTALLQAAVERYAGEFALELEQFRAGAARGRPQVRSETGRDIDLRCQGGNYHFHVSRRGATQYDLQVDGRRIRLNLERLGKFEYWLTVRNVRRHIVSLAEPTTHRIEVEGVAHRVDCDAGGIVRSPAPAVVVSIDVEPGQTVEAGQQVAVLEAMKMEMYVTAPCSGTVRQIFATPHVQAPSGAALIQIEPDSYEPRRESAPRVLFDDVAEPASSAAGADAACMDSLDDLRQLALGFDVESPASSRIRQQWGEFCAFPADPAEVTRREDDILAIFGDICSLFRRQAADEDEAVSLAPHSAEWWLFTYLRTFDTRELPAWFIDDLNRALAHYGLNTRYPAEELQESLLWICKSHARVEQQIAPVMALLERRLERAHTLAGHVPPSQRLLLDRLVSVTRGSFPALSDLAQELAYRLFDQPLFESAKRQIYEVVEAHLAALSRDPHGPSRHEHVRALIECPQPLESLFATRYRESNRAMRELILEIITSRYYRIRTLSACLAHTVNGAIEAVSSEYEFEGRHIHVFAACSDYHSIETTSRAMFPLLDGIAPDDDVVIDFYVWHGRDPDHDSDAVEQTIRSALNRAGFTRRIRRIVAAVGGSGPGHDAIQHYTWRQTDEGFVEEKFCRGLHPMMGKRVNLWRFRNFHLERLPSADDVYLFHAVAHDNPKDERLFACAEVRDLTPVRNADGQVIQLPYLERMFNETLASIRLYQAHRRPQERLQWNRILLYLWPPMSCTQQEFHEIVRRLLPATEGLGLEQVVVRARIPNPETGELRDMVIRISSQGGANLLMTFRPAADQEAFKPLAEYDRKVVRMRQRGLIYPFEIIRMLTPGPDDTQASFPPGEFLEHDLDGEGRLAPVARPWGQNTANVIAGLIWNNTPTYPEGMTRVILMGDPSRDLGALAEPECRRIIAAIDLAERLHVPVEWFALSAGAKISMESGVENMDWIARVLRRLVEFTQAAGEVNIIIDGINVGAQPYWNAEATMLMHTRGILVMTSRAAMVLTGKRALEYSGSVSAEDNQGIGGYDRIMGVNGQAQYHARDIDDACHILLRHYDHTYVAPGERFPRRAATSDPLHRDVRQFVHAAEGSGDGFALVGEILSDATNPGRKKPFDIRRVMLSVSDQDHLPLERWAGMRDAECAVVWDAHLGGFPVCMIGIESKPLPRIGFVPADGPDQWTAGTLFPLSSKKVARAINAASGNRPVVVLANLSGFDGSPESMRKLQLEYGAEIGRAVVNFRGPMVFCVISRYHGGAYVVFSRTLNEQMEIAAIEGSYASVIGGAPAAAVVFASEVDARARKDPRLRSLEQAMETAEPAEKARLRAEWDQLFKLVHSEKLGQLASEFDAVHSVHRALQVGALHRIIEAKSLRPYLIDAVQRGIERELHMTVEETRLAGVSS